MFEATKALNRRLRDSRFTTRYFVGNGIDIGAGADPLSANMAYFDHMQSCIPWDVADGDAQTMAGLENQMFDFVHSSHCLEHMRDPFEAIANWLRILKPGGHMVVTVPDEDLYEQGVFPSSYNEDHKWTFTIHKQDSWSPRSINILTLLDKFSGIIQIIKVEQLDEHYFWGLPRFDQTLRSSAECSIEFILRKLPEIEKKRLGRYPDAGSECGTSDGDFRNDVMAALDQIECTTTDDMMELTELLRANRHQTVAEWMCHKIIEKAPGFAEAYKCLGNIMLDSGRLEEAESIYKTALELNESFGEVYNNLGNLCRITLRFAESEQYFRKALLYLPDNAAVYNNLGILFLDMKRFTEAEGVFRKSILCNEKFAFAYNNRGNALVALGKLDVAEKCYRQAIQLIPNYAEANNNLGLACVQAGKFADAEYAYHNALNMSPDNTLYQFNLGCLYHLQGELEKGFSLFERHFDSERKWSEALSSAPRWRGESLARKSLLIQVEQGAGDTIMMLRYLPYIKALGAKRLTVSADLPLKRLIESVSSVDSVVLPDELIDERFDYLCPMMCFPHYFTTTLSSIPHDVPYVSVSSGDRRAWQERMAGYTNVKVKVGLVWAGNSQYRHSLQRDISLSCFAPLAEIDNIQLFSLQKGEAAGQLRGIDWDIVDMMDVCSDYNDTAAYIEQLDLVIAVDTSVAHLAGALGKPVWLLNRYGSEWRWMIGRDDSPWYPSMRIFTQVEWGEWCGVISCVAAELHLLMEKLSKG